MSDSIKIANKYVIKYSNKIPYLYNNGVHVPCSPIVLQEIVKMHQLLVSVADAEFEESPVEALHKAVDDVSKYIASKGK